MKIGTTGALHRTTWLILLALAAALLSGCAPYRLRGVVLEGTTPAVSVVEESDPRLKQMGLEGAAVTFSLDPTGMAPKTVGTATTNMEGHFEIRVDAIGVGMLEYELGVLSRSMGYQDVWEVLPMPPKGRCLVVIMVPGRGGERSGDLLKDTMKIHDELNAR